MLRDVAELSDDVRALLEARNIVHLATVLPDGAPHSVPVWGGLEDGRIAFFTQPTSRKARNVAREPRVSLSIVDHDNPYRMAHIRGRVVETREGDEALEIMDRMSRRYTGEDFPMRSGVAYLIEPEHEAFMELPFKAL
jgi:PPOX class probable F420-dependent enzyme